MTGSFSCSSQQRPLEQTKRKTSQYCLPRSLPTARHSRRIRLRRSNEKTWPINCVAILNVLEFNLYRLSRTEGPQLNCTFLYCGVELLCSVPYKCQSGQRSLTSWLPALGYDVS